MYDAIIIGGGTGGYTCAIKISQLGGKPLIIEKDMLGGCCTNKGCIPTKALLKSAKLFHDIKNASRFGINIENAEPDFEAIFKRAERVASVSRKGIDYLLKSYKVEVIYGEGQIIGANKVSVENTIFEAKNIVFATGSAPKNIPGLNFNDFVLNSDLVFNLKELPKSLVIIGGGSIGVEFSNIFAFLGTKVTLIEMFDNIVPAEDIEISKELEKILKRYGIDIYTKSSVEVKEKSVIVIKENIRKVFNPEKVLIAIGRTPSINEDCLKSLGVEFCKDGININSQTRTNINNIFAIGDVTGKYQLAHVAIKQGIVAAHNIMGYELAIAYKSIPKCIYTRPEIGSIGLRSQDDKSLQTGKFPFISSGKARTDEDKDGFIKVLTKNDKVVGVHIIGGVATELLGEAGIMINEALDLNKITKNIHPHPTFSESIVQAIEDVNNLAIDLQKQ